MLRDGGNGELIMSLDWYPDRDAEQEVEALTRTVNDDPPYRKVPQEPHAALKPPVGSDMVTARWQGGDGRKIRARSKRDSGRVTVQIDGMDGVTHDTLERLVDLLSHEVEREG